MDFNSNKDALLKRMSAMKKGKDYGMRIMPARDSSPEAADESGRNDERKQVVLFAFRSPFIETVMATIERQYAVRFFDDAETAAAFCADNTVECTILDMDEPTDWRMATDVFTGVKTTRPGARMVLLVKNPAETQVRTLAAKGGAILKKPFTPLVLFRYIEGRGVA